jgi:hypothetical protein
MLWGFLIHVPAVRVRTGAPFQDLAGTIGYVLLLDTQALQVKRRGGNVLMPKEIPDIG